MGVRVCINHSISHQFFDINILSYRHIWPSLLHGHRFLLIVRLPILAVPDRDELANGTASLRRSLYQPRILGPNIVKNSLPEHLALAS